MKEILPLPPPIPGEGDVWLDVLADMPESDFKKVCEARREFGIKKYGQPLQYNDGRDPMLDLFQELLDAVVYAKKAEKAGIISDKISGYIKEFTKDFYDCFLKEKRYEV